VAQALEAGSAAESELRDVRQVGVVLVEKPGRLAGDEGQVFLDDGQRLDARPVMDLLDEVARAGIGDGVGHLGEDVLGIGQLDHGGLLGGPEGLPAPAQAVLVFCEELMKVLEEYRQTPAVVDDDRVIVIRAGAEADEADVALAARKRQAVNEGVVGLAVRAHEEAALGAAPGDEVAAAWDDGTGQGHAGLSVRRRAKLSACWPFRVQCHGHRVPGPAPALARASCVSVARLVLREHVE